MDNNTQEKHFIEDILKALLLSKQQVQGQYGPQETLSIFETVLNTIGTKFKINENLISELQIEFVQYVKDNKEKILLKVADEMASKIQRFDSYDFKNMIRSSETLKAIIEKSIIEHEGIKKAISEIMNRDFPELSKKITEGQVEIKVNVNLK